MDFRLSSIRSSSAKDSIETATAILCALDSHGLTHDRAASAEDLKVGHGPSTRRDMASGSGKRAKSGGGCFVEERAHVTRLTKESVHCDEGYEYSGVWQVCIYSIGNKRKRLRSDNPTVSQYRTDGDDLVGTLLAYQK